MFKIIILFIYFRFVVGVCAPLYLQIPCLCFCGSEVPQVAYLQNASLNASPTFHWLWLVAISVWTTFSDLKFTTTLRSLNFLGFCFCVRRDVCFGHRFFVRNLAEDVFAWSKKRSLSISPLQFAFWMTQSAGFLCWAKTQGGYSGHVCKNFIMCAVHSKFPCHKSKWNLFVLFRFPVWGFFRPAVHFLHTFSQILFEMFWPKWIGIKTTWPSEIALCWKIKG